MKYRTRTYYTDSQKALMWERWKQGWTLHQIGKLFDRAHTSVQGILGASGGIRPTQRHRALMALTLAEREEISRAMVAGRSIRAIAALLGRAASTVSREIRRNGGQECYRASQADQAAWDRGHRPKICKLAQNRTLARIVTDKLRRLWSPEQTQAYLSVREPPRVTRDHLPQPLHPGAWRPEEGTPAALEAHPRHASVPAPHPED
jgi:phytoene dehydrogenase-like protein